MAKRAIVRRERRKAKAYLAKGVVRAPSRKIGHHSNAGSKSTVAPEKTSLYTIGWRGRKAKKEEGVPPPPLVIPLAEHLVRPKGTDVPGSSNDEEIE
jgi:hypothetical protein